MSESAAPRRRFTLLGAERAALAFGVWQFLDHALCVEMYRRLWVLSLVPTLILILVGVTLLVRFTAQAIEADEMNVRDRWRTFLAVPLVTLLVQGVSFEPMRVPQTLAAHLYFAAHRAEWARAAAASIDGVYSLEYLHGVPDGSAHFVHVPSGRPEDLPVKRQLWIAGERLASCKRFADDWLCWFD